MDGIRGIYVSRAVVGSDVGLIADTLDFFGAAQRPFTPERSMLGGVPALFGLGNWLELKGQDLPFLTGCPPAAAKLFQPLVKRLGKDPVRAHIDQSAEKMAVAGLLTRQVSWFNEP